MQHVGDNFTTKMTKYVGGICSKPGWYNLHQIISWLAGVGKIWT